MRENSRTAKKRGQNSLETVERKRRVRDVVKVPEGGAWFQDNDEEGSCGGETIVFASSGDCCWVSEVVDRLRGWRFEIGRGVLLRG